MKRVVILTGAGMSAESGIKTFRDNDGLWEEYDVMDVATPEAWARDMEMVNRFYNERRKQLYSCEPNRGHLGLAELEDNFIVNIITQNVDDLHERAGSSNVLHLHGELKKVRSSINPTLISDLDGWEVKIGDRCSDGSQIRPHIVWFGEDVPEIANAIPIVESADIVVIIGTSMAVYPAANLINYAHSDCEIYLIDPQKPDMKFNDIVTHIEEGASRGVEILKGILKR